MIGIAIRLVLALAFGAFGLFISRPDVWPNLPFETPPATAYIVAAVLAIVGLLAPDWIEILARSAVAKIAEKVGEQVVSQLSSRVPFVGTSAKRKRVRKEFNKELRGALILDTSSIIDGRIGDVAVAGFLRGNVVVIPGVLTELRHIADSREDQKRERGRLGLEVLNKLKKEKSLRLKILDIDPAGDDVDERLVGLARKIKGAIVTVDYNLSRAAAAAGVSIVNINDLANALKAVTIPGETLQIKVEHVGKEKTQGVGYLFDGTMVVVEGGAELVGRTIDAKVMRAFQTSAGRMIFVKKVENG